MEKYKEGLDKLNIWHYNTLRKLSYGLNKLIVAQSGFRKIERRR
jgi:hypothetical protein